MFNFKGNKGKKKIERSPVRKRQKDNLKKIRKAKDKRSFSFKGFFSLKIATKLSISFLTIAVLATLTIAYDVFEINKLRILSDKMYEYPYIMTKNVLEAQNKITAIKGTMQNVARADDLNAINFLVVDIENKEKEVASHLKTVETIVSKEDPAGFELISKTVKIFNSWIPVRKKVISLFRAGKTQAAVSLFQGRNIKLMNQLSGSIDSLVKHASIIANKYHTNTGSIAKTTLLYSAVSAVALLLFIIFIFMIISRTIKSSLSTTTKSISKLIDERDLTRVIDTGKKDEMGLLSAQFNVFVQSIHEIFQKMKIMSAEVTLRSREMTSQTTEFSDSAQSQAASAEEITATTEEILAGVSNVAGNAQDQFDEMEGLIHRIKDFSTVIADMEAKSREMLQLAQNISGYAKTGGENLNQMSSSMNTISDSSSEVSNIIQIINDISDQINLLSLNAAIEAARAGEAGKGFAVVADEISNLADKTSSSVQDISTLISKNDTEIQKGMNNVDSTVQTISKILEGVNSISKMMQIISQHTRKQLEENRAIDSEAEKAKSRSEEIKIATEEQKTASQEIVKSISTISESIQFAANSTEHITHTINEFLNLAGKLDKEIRTFKVDDVIDVASLTADEVSENSKSANSNLEEKIEIDIL